MNFDLKVLCGSPSLGFLTANTQGGRELRWGTGSDGFECDRDSPLRDYASKSALLYSRE